jgi:hypothetical protein
MKRTFLTASLVLLASCASPGPREPTPREQRICETSGRSFGVETYRLKRSGRSLERALMLNEGAVVYDRITRTIYTNDVNSEEEASEVGWRLCIDNFTNR